jgi:cysteinyl-tRNA synthetase
MVVEEYRQKFIEAMDDDFNTAKALAILFDLAHDINRVGEARYGVDDAKQMLLELAGVLGLKLQETRTVHKVSVGGGEVKISKRLSARLTVPDAVGTLVDRLVEERLKCRQEKNWQRADEIRKKLTELGVILEDTKEGTDVAYKSVPSEDALKNL